MYFIGGTDGKVMFINDDGELSELGEFEWGSTGPKCAALAKAMLSKLYGPTKAIQLHRLYLRRTIMTWDKNQDWAQTDLDVEDVVQKILEAQREMAPEVNKMKREPPRGLMGVGLGGAKWGSQRTGYQGGEPQIVRNDPSKAKPGPKSIHDGNVPLKR